MPKGGTQLQPYTKNNKHRSKSITSSLHTPTGFILIPRREQKKKNLKKPWLRASPLTPSSTVGHVRPMPTPSRSSSTPSGCHCCTLSTARARWHVAVVAQLRRLARLGRVAGLPGVVAAAGGTDDRPGSGLGARSRATQAAASRAALHAAALLVKDLEG